jgi:hypothetical protein
MVAAQPQIRCFYASGGGYGGWIGRVRRGIRRKSSGYGLFAEQTIEWRTQTRPQSQEGSALWTGLAPGLSFSLNLFQNVSRVLEQQP